MTGYTSIPHLPGSRLDRGDHRATPEQVTISTVRANDGDLIIVQEKLDGSNVAVIRQGDLLVPLTRSGGSAWSSRHEQHRLFAHWVSQHTDRFLAHLGDGDRLAGEWLAQAHGTRYVLFHEPFVAFDLWRGSRRLTADDLPDQVGFVTPRVIHRGTAISVPDIVARLEPSGHGAIDPVEGAVWRVERAGTVAFLAKYVRPSVVAGHYLPTAPGQVPIWNWHRW